MGCGFSSASLSPCAGVRVIHTNGYVEDFLGPGVVTVAHVTGCHGGAADSAKGPGAASSSSPPRFVLCSAAHLLQPGQGPFRPDDPLQPGTVYFLLPHSVLEAESSAVDLACLMNRLTALARKGAATAAPAPSPVEALFAAATPPRAPKEKEPAASPARPAPWRPRLDRIDESIGRASTRSASSCSEA